MISKFINREKELEALKREYNKKGSSFVVVYGRRRTGKTTLLKNFILNKKDIYFLVDLQNERIQIERFKNIIAQSLKDEFLSKASFDKWETLFEYVSKKTGKKKIVIIIDEFQYLAKINHSIPSIFQKIWDDNLKNKNIMLILCGSLISLMYEYTLNYSSPLYGRRTSQIKLEPLNFFSYKKFFKNKNNDEMLRFYGITGGVPKYIELMDKNKDAFQNIKANILDKNSFLYSEPKFVLKDEIKEPVNYFSILQVVSQGAHKIGHISEVLGVQSKNITSFLEKLIELEIIERIVPITEKNPQKSKRGLFFIKDNFFNFWFRYVFPYQSYLETDKADFVFEKIRKDFNIYISRLFETVSIDFTMRQNLPFEIKKIGKWWEKDKEIDLIALGDKTILFGECKYWKDKIGLNVLNGLKEKSKFVNWENGKRAEYFALYSKSGFTEDIKKYAKKEKNLFLFNLKDF
ncbi:MAG: ATP-binding protein [Elusimicrobia bacterium]|nr:ATP-binding protein [Elusimicrobiota bacterium]